MKNIILIGYLFGSLLVQSPASDVSVRDDIPAHEPHTAVHFTLDSINGVTLYDDPTMVLEKKGKPLRLSNDIQFDEIEIYEYADMTIAFRDDMIEYVHISCDADSITLDDHTVPVTLAALKSALGKPDFTAEDGIVYQRGKALLKLFIDPASGELQSISYYHIAAV